MHEPTHENDDGDRRSVEKVVDGGLVELAPRPLTRFATTGGCAAKVGPGELDDLMRELGAPTEHDGDSAVLVGTETGDDAGVYRIDDERALVVTADFITPPCDDPFRYGEIAAANALSDVYAMGGRPTAAVALCAFPKELPAELARGILAGGQAKAREAGAYVLGGHTVRNPELLYGLSVTGLVAPRRLLRNVGARPGDALVLTKPLGTGLLVNGRRKGLGSDAHFQAALDSMALLNRAASEVLARFDVHAATDVTGFGMLGHALKMARGSGVTLALRADALPFLDGALALAAAGVTTGSTRPNRENVAAHLHMAGTLDGNPGGRLPPVLDALLCDPQTSGGLLVSLPGEQADRLLAALGEAGVERAACIGAAHPVGAAPLIIGGAFDRFA